MRSQRNKKGELVRILLLIFIGATGILVIFNWFTKNEAKNDTELVSVSLGDG